MNRWQWFAGCALVGQLVHVGALHVDTWAAVASATGTLLYVVSAYALFCRAVAGERLPRVSAGDFAATIAEIALLWPVTLPCFALLSVANWKGPRT